jgi:hypothetical protein
MKMTVDLGVYQNGKRIVKSKVRFIGPIRNKEGGADEEHESGKH